MGMGHDHSSREIKGKGQSQGRGLKLGQGSSEAIETTAAAPARNEVEAVVRSPTNMATAKIAAVDFIDLY